MSFVASLILYNVPSLVLTKAGPPTGCIVALLFLFFFEFDPFPFDPLSLFSSNDLIIVQGVYKCLLLKRSESSAPSSLSPFFEFLLDGVLNACIPVPGLVFSFMINNGSKKYSTIAFPVTCLKKKLKVVKCKMYNQFVVQSVGNCRVINCLYPVILHPVIYINTLKIKKLTRSTALALSFGSEGVL